MTTLPDPRSPEGDGGKQSGPSPIKVFYSYADEDKDQMEKLDAHLSPLKRKNSIEVFHHGMILGGADWEREVKAYLKQAQIILLLISPDFFGKHYESGEVKEILAHYIKPNEAGMPYIIPILLRPSLWEDDEQIARLMPFPRSRKPVSTSRDHDKAFSEIGNDIKKVIENLGEAGTVRIFARFSILPPRRNPFFTGRKELLTQLRNNLTQQKPIALTQPQAISGLGGVGKTQIAVEYVYRYRAHYQNVFWVNADTRGTLIKEYVKIAEGLGLAERNKQNQRLTVAAVKRWLEEHSGWLLVLDNADNIALIREFIPNEANGHVLLTTRSTAVGDIAERLEIEKMKPDEGEQLLLRRAKKMPPAQPLTTTDQMDAKKIVDKLDGLPLALDQAGAYIEETGCGLARYLQLYENENKRAELLKRRGKLSADHPASVVATFMLAFEKVEQADKAAADLLRLCAFLAPDAIPETLLESDQEKLDEACEVLLNFSLIQRDNRTLTLAVHRLVQAVLKDHMDEDTKRHWAVHAVHNVTSAFPTTIEVNTWPECQKLLPHVLACTRIIDEYKIISLVASQLLNNAGLYLFQRAQYREAEPLYQQALKIRERTVVPHDPFLAQSLHNLGDLYERLGKYSEAEQQLKRALGIREHIMGQKHAATAASLNSLAEVYRKQKKYEKAEPLYERALEIYERVSAIDRQKFGRDPSTLERLSNLVTLYNNLATFYLEQGKYGKAEPLYNQALEMSKKNLGENHPFTAQILHDFAELYKAQQKMEEAERLHKQALKIREQVLGAENPDTAASLNSLAELYERQQKRERAEQLYQRALAIRKKKLGFDNPDTAATMYDLARLYEGQQKRAEAEQLYQQALDIRERVLEVNDPSILQNQKALADLYQSQGRVREAKRLFVKALDSRYQQLRPDDPTIGQSLLYLARLYASQNKYEEVEQLYEEAFLKCSKRFGMDDRSTQHCWRQLMKLYNKGPIKEGKIEWLYVQAFNLRARSLREDDSSTIDKFKQSVNDLAELYEGQKQIEKLKRLYELAAKICHTQLGANHPLRLQYLDTLMSLPVDSRSSSNHDKQKEEPVLAKATLLREHTIQIPKQFQDEEEQRLEQKLQEAYEKPGVNDPATVKLRHELAQLYEKHEKPKEAERVYRQAWMICILKLEPDHAATIECQNDLARCYWNHGKYDDAKPLIRDALAICQPMLEKTDRSREYTLACVHSLDNAAFLYQRQLNTRELNIRRLNPRGELTKAEVLIRQALVICEQALGEEHPETIVICEHHADLLQNMGLDDEAKAIKIRATTMGKIASTKREYKRPPEVEPH